jgi:hypothetical protein
MTSVTIRFKWCPLPRIAHAFSCMLHRHSCGHCVSNLRHLIVTGLLLSTHLVVKDSTHITIYRCSPCISFPQLSSCCSPQLASSSCPGSFAPHILPLHFSNAALCTSLRIACNCPDGQPRCRDHCLLCRCSPRCRHR